MWAALFWVEPHPPLEINVGELPDAMQPALPPRLSKVRLVVHPANLSVSRFQFQGKSSVSRLMDVPWPHGR